MNRKPNPKKLIQETLRTTKKFLHRTVIKTLKSLYQNLPKTSRSDLIFPDNNSSKISSKNQKVLHNVCMKKNAPFTGLTKDVDEEKSVADHSKSRDLKREENARKKSSSFRGAEALARKMKELEMMDINDDQDHALDIEEVLHNYSQLSCPAYLEMVDKFFMDMYTELLVPLPLGSVNSSMRKVGSNSVYSSMRSLGPIKL